MVKVYSQRQFFNTANPRASQRKPVLGKNPEPEIRIISNTQRQEKDGIRTENDTEKAKRGKFGAKFSKNVGRENFWPEF